MANTPGILVLSQLARTGDQLAQDLSMNVKPSACPTVFGEGALAQLFSPKADPPMKTLERFGSPPNGSDGHRLKLFVSARAEPRR